MSEQTNIEWATSTGNPWIGCTKVSPGCAHCYAAELDANRFSRTMGGGTKENPVSHWGKGAPRFRTKSFWNDALSWNARAWICDTCGKFHTAHADCLGTKGHRPRIFPSLCDWLDDEVPSDWLSDFLKLIHDTPNLDWLLLTKRPKLFEERLIEAYAHCDTPYAKWVDQWRTGEVIPRNVWIGVSVEDQKRADERIHALLQIPSYTHFLSVEPLLEEVDLKLDKILNPDYRIEPPPVIDWIIIGGESGKGRRDCGIGAIIGAANQCVVASVPCFVKQDCAAKPGQKGRIPDYHWALKQFPKGAL